MKKKEIVDDVTMKRAITRITYEIIERNKNLDKIVLAGIKTRGVYIAQRIQERLKQLENLDVPLIELDTKAYRDDVKSEQDTSLIPIEIDGTDVILVDDVLYTGRTIRAAIDNIVSHGRPARVGLAVLVDRGHRELPIRADYVGKNIPTSESEEIEVLVTENNVKYDVNDMPKVGLLVGLSFQHLFAMFGATVLVPILVGIDPAIALFSSGLGTLAHLTVTKYKIPAYMGSSFAYIAAMQMLMKTDGIGAVAQGAMAGGLVYLIVALVVKYVGNAWIDRVLPPIVVGPIIIVIGLSLAANAVKDATMVNDTYSIFSLVISMVTLFSVILFNMYGKKIIGVIPILLGLIVGYIFSVVLGWLTGHEFVQFSKVAAAHWFQVPSFDIPFVNYDFKLYPSAILTMAPIAFVTMTEHFGHVMVLNSLTGRDYFKDPGLDRTLTGDGLAQIIAGFFGAPPVTSYGENIGVMALSKVYSVYVIAGAAVIAVLMSFIGKLSALLHSIPTPVLGGLSIALFGVIAASGLKILVEHKIDFDNKKNLLIASVILVSGIGGLMIDLGGFQITGVASSTILGILLYQILPDPNKGSKN